MSLNRATEWGRWIAAYFRSQGEKNPFLLAVKFGWRVSLENEAKFNPLMPERMAEWDGSRRMIRLYLPLLRGYLGNSMEVLHRACAHELFHGLAMCNYRFLKSFGVDVPRLNYREEEIAAQVFSETLLSFQNEVELCPSSVLR